MFWMLLSNFIYYDLIVNGFELFWMFKLLFWVYRNVIKFYLLSASHSLASLICFSWHFLKVQQNFLCWCCFQLNTVLLLSSPPQHHLIFPLFQWASYNFWYNVDYKCLRVLTLVSYLMSKELDLSPLNITTYFAESFKLGINFRFV